MCSVWTFNQQFPVSTVHWSNVSSTLNQHWLSVSCSHQPIKEQTSTQCWYNGGPPSATLPKSIPTTYPPTGSHVLYVGVAHKIIFEPTLFHPVSTHGLVWTNPYLSHFLRISLTHFWWMFNLIFKISYFSSSSHIVASIIELESIIITCIWSNVARVQPRALQLSQIVKP